MREREGGGGGRAERGERDRASQPDRWGGRRRVRGGGGGGGIELENFNTQE